MANDPTDFGPRGDPSRHLALDRLEHTLRTLPRPPRDSGRVVLVVRRGPDKARDTPASVELSPGGGVAGDAWGRGDAHPDTEVTVMQVDVAGLIANGQPLTLFGDNLLVDLDLSVENLPVGSRVRIGCALLEVTAKPHNGCHKFAARFGQDAQRLVWKADLRHLNLRGIHMRVLEAGQVATGDPVDVLARPTA